jgi:hypothetical protein
MWTNLIYGILLATGQPWTDTLWFEAARSNSPTPLYSDYGNLYIAAYERCLATQYRAGSNVLYTLSETRPQWDGTDTSRWWIAASTNGAGATNYFSTASTTTQHVYTVTNRAGYLYGAPYGDIPATQWRETETPIRYQWGPWQTIELQNIGATWDRTYYYAGTSNHVVGYLDPGGGTPLTHGPANVRLRTDWYTNAANATVLTDNGPRTQSRRWGRMRGPSPYPQLREFFPAYGLYLNLSRAFDAPDGFLGGPQWTAYGPQESARWQDVLWIDGSATAGPASSTPMPSLLEAGA